LQQFIVGVEVPITLERESDVEVFVHVVLSDEIGGLPIVA
jgi:hypothetical protein